MAKKKISQPPKMPSEAAVEAAMKEGKKASANVPKPLAAPKAKKINPSRVGLAKYVRAISPSYTERREMRGQELTLAKSHPRQPAASVGSPFKGEIAPVRGAITPARSPVAASGKLKVALRSLKGGKVRALGYLGAGFIPSEKAQTAISASVHAGTARQASKLVGKQVIRRALPWFGAAAAVADITAAGSALSGYVKAEKEAQHRREVMAARYASPLVHQQALRAGRLGRPPVGAVGAPEKPKPTVSITKPVTGRSPFGSAFATARKAGKSEFEYKGKKYHTRLRGEVSRVKAPEVKPVPKVFSPEKDISNIAMADVTAKEKPKRKWGFQKPVARPQGR